MMESISVPSLAILVSAVLVLSCGQNHYAIGVSNKAMSVTLQN